MAKHTPEPWVYHDDRKGIITVLRRFEKPDCVPAKVDLFADYRGGEVCAVRYVPGPGAVPTREQAVANARRIVACANACQGITTEALENGAVADLLAACRRCLDAWEQDGSDDLPLALEIRAAVAKATGG